MTSKTCISPFEVGPVALNRENNGDETLNIQDTRDRAMHATCSKFYAQIETKKKSQGKGMLQVCNFQYACMYMRVCVCVCVCVC